MNRLSAPVATSSLLVADAECGQIQDLISGSKAPVLALTAQAQGRVLGQISEGLLQQRKAGQPVRTLHLIAHGRPGAFRIGDGWIDAEALKAHAADLAHWGVETIALWSCHVGADADFVALLAELSGAQVLASADWLGRDADGKQQLQLGDWRLSDLVKQESWPAQFRLEKDEDKLKPGIYFTADNGSHIYLNGKQLKFDLGGGKTAPGTWDWRQGFYSPLDNIVIEAGKNVLAIAAWDSEEIAGINGHFKFSDSVEISTSDKDGWWVYNADTRMDGRYTPDGTTGLYSYQIKDEDKGLGKDGSKIHGQFPEDEDALISLFEAVDGESPDIPDSEGEKNLHWTEVDYQMKKAPDRSEGLILEGFWVNPGRSKAINGDKNPSPWPAGGDTDQTPDTTWLWYGERLLYEGKDPATDYPSKDKDGEDKNPNNDWTKHNYSLFRLEFDALFAITGRGMCEEETDFGSTSQFVKAGFTIEFDGPLNGSKTFDFELTGDGGDVEFGIPDGGLYAFNADGPVEGVELIEGTLSYDKRTNTYSGQLLVEDGVEGLELGARWEKKSGDLTGQENVTLTFSEGNGQEGGVITTDTKTVVLDEDGDGTWEKDCPPLSPAALFTVTASAACENEKTEPLTDASFTFEVKGAVDPASGEQDSLKGMYSYVLEAEGKRVGSEYAGYSYRIEDVNGRQLDNKKVVVQPDGDGKGTLEVLTDLREFRVVFDVTTLVVGDQLVGDEEVTLKLSNTDYTVSDEATASLKNEELNCDPFESEPGLTVTATAACEIEETELLTDASFTFVVKGAVDPGSREPDSLRGTYKYVLETEGERVGSEYAGYSYRIEDVNGRQLDNKKVVVQPNGDGTGTLEVLTDLKEFRVVFDVGSLVVGDQLVGDEEVSLTLKNMDDAEIGFATASLKNDDLGCDSVESNPVFTITPTAACENEATALLTDASFTFSVQGAVDPGSRERDSLKGMYDYVLLVDGERVGSEYAGYDYRIEDINGNSLRNVVRVDEGEVGDGVGTLEVNENISEFRVVFDVEALADGDQLSGDESVTLSLARRGTYANDYAYATASLADDDLGCDPLVDPDDQEIFLEPFAACVKDGVLSSSTAEFVFNGEFKPSTTEAREVAYVIDTSSGLLDGDYALNLQFSNGISLKEGGSTGVLEVEEGVGDFSIEITAAAADSLTGDESITLTLYDESEVITKTASLDKLDCAPEPEDKGKTDVQLYLLMDNSTSMLQSDPSTALAGQANRLESQDRVSLYAYQQALEKAGYGFSRKGESGLLSTAAFKDAVIKNSAADLAEVLNDFEVIVDPNHSGNAQDLTLHLISYGYAVDYGSFTITADDPSAGKQAAEAIIGLQTPDQIYGNSIDGNTLWSERGLPTVTADDTFWGEGRPASNLYSGTEMLGALEGLEHLLAAQLNRGAADPITTYISMTTDGRPERRAWWDTRIGPGSDSLTGQPVPLPGRLGGDAITTSGLIYDLDGDATFLNNNAGEQQWTAMQNRLNATLDAIAAQQTDPSNRLQVSVLGMGDGSDANFPAIYSDLFGLRTFNNSAGGWSYDYNTSYALPDFFG